MTIKVAVNGYGTIGKRIADAFLNLDGFELAGIVKYTPDFSAILASRKGIPIYVPRERFSDFKKVGIEPEGTPEDLVETSDIIYDASPAGMGARNKYLYEKYKKPAIFQGGEKPDVADLSYSTLCNYEQAVGKSYLRVVSCNTTGILRVLCSIGVRHVKSMFGVIIRRASDPKEDTRGPVNSIQLDPATIPSHHTVDVVSVVGGAIDVKTVGVIVPSTLMHLQILELEFNSRVSEDEVLDALNASGRILAVEPGLLGLDTTGRIVEFARDAGRKRNDVYENVVFRSMIKVDESKAILVQGIHQESIVIPENVDAAFAALSIDMDPIRVVDRVNRALGIGHLKTLISKASI